MSSTLPEGRFAVSTVTFAGSTVGVAAGVVGSLGTFFSSLPVLLIALLFSGIAYPWLQYHDEAIETGEQFMRGTVYPAWRDTVRPIWNQIRRLINSLSCWISGFNWWAYGVVTNVVYPVIRDCGPGTFFANVGEFVLAFFNDFVVDYFIALEFYNGPCDFTNICDKWIAMWTSWIDLYSCSCSDLSLFLRTLPIIPSLFFSEQWTDMQTWCFISNAINAMMEVLSILLTLISQTLQAIFFLIAPQSPFAQLNFTRPNFYNAAELFCQSGNCLGRSIENAIQRFWNAYIPWTFDFTNYLSVFDGFLCFVIKTINWAITFVVNIDKVLQYPSDPFWETVMKPLTIENLNLVGPPSQWSTVFAPMPPAGTQFTMKNYYLDTNSPFTPSGGPNPVFGKLRMTEGACIFIDRTICDPENTSTACFSQSAANLLRGLDFCCLTNTLTVLALDLTTAFIEFTYHLTSGADRFFLFIDNQPFTTVLVDSITPLARCLVSIFTLIPVVGFALQNLIVEVVCFLASVIDFFWRTLVGLASLPYFLIEMPGTENFLTMTGRAIDQWVALFDKLIAETPTSALNSLCILLNTGFPIPPIPCGSCDVTGFIPLPPDQSRREQVEEKAQLRKRRFYNPDTGKIENTPWSLAAEALGWQNPESAYLVTPLITYSNWTLNPFELRKMITISSESLSKPGVLPFPNHKTVDDFFDARKEYMLSWWNDEKMCKDLKREEAQLRREKPHMWKYYKQQGKYDCKEGETYETSRKRRMGIDYSPSSSSSIKQDYLLRNEYNPFRKPRPHEYLNDWFITEGGNETNLHHQGDRLTLGETIPPTVGCSNPTPDCFDLCCLFRSVTKTFAHSMQGLGRFFNGFVQYEKERYGTKGDFPYFTGEFCDPQFNRDCFESDLVTFILLFFENFTCLCRFLNLVIPVTPDNPRPDLCCAILRVSEFIACLLMVIINAITALAMGAEDGFAYYTEGFFFNDVSTLFDILLEVVFCACVLVRAVFPLNYIPGLREAVRFDPCCLPSALAITLVEFLRLVTLTIISLATITVNDDSFCFFRLDTTSGCSGTLDGIGIVQRFDVMMNSFLPVSDSGFPGSCRDNCGKDQSRNGVVPCICEVLNTIIPWRTDPSRPVSCEAEDLNCQIVDFCCPFVQLGFALQFALTFLSRLTVALWQPWTPLPEFAIHYMFCEEEELPPDGYCGSGNAVNACLYTGSMQPTPTCNCGQFSCGKINPIIQALANPTEGLIARCLCELFVLLDDLLVMVFESIGSSWQGCFCGPENGTLLSGPLVAEQLLRAVVGFLRKFPLPCYWQPAGRVYSAVQPPGMPPTASNCVPLVDTNCVCVFEKAPMFDVQDSWFYSFLGPTIEAMCISVGNLMCFINSIFFIPGQCLTLGEKFLGSTLRWGFELPLRVIAAIEGFVRQFTDPIPTCVGSDPMCEVTSTGTYNGVGAAPLGRILTSLFTWFVDSLIGDSVVSCTRICPEGSARVNNTGTCDCWNISPKTRALDINRNPVFDLVINGTDGFGNPLYACEYARLAFYGATSTLSNLRDPQNQMGVGAVFPICQALQDFNPGSTTYPGSCANYGLCRPDSLPVCEVPDGQGFATQAFNLEGPIDGQFNGLIRYIACAIDFGTDTTIGSQLALIMLRFNSIIWQLYGGVMRFVAAWIVFLLSFFNLGSGCDCHNYADPRQSFQGVAGEVKHSQGGGITVGFCYPCPDANAMCGDDPKSPLVCEPHCPCFQNGTNAAVAQQECIAHLTEYSRVDNWPSGATAASLCDGSYQDDWLQGRCGNNINCRNSQIANWIREEYTQSSCPRPYCQAIINNGTGMVDFPGVPQRNTFTGSTVPAQPKVLCSFLTLLKNLLSVFDAFAAIFSTPIILPDMKKRSSVPGMDTHMTRQEFMNQVKRPLTRENRTSFLKRMGVLKEYPRPRDMHASKWDYLENHQLVNQTIRDASSRDMQRVYTLLGQYAEHKKRGLPNDVALQSELFKLYEQVEQRLIEAHVAPQVQVVEKEALDFHERMSQRETYMMGHSMTSMWHSTDPHTGQLPSGPEMLVMALYDFDTSDCFDDPVACVCRNFDMSQHCHWSLEFGVMPTPITPSTRRFARQHDEEWLTRHTINDTFYPPRQVHTSAFTQWKKKRQRMDEEFQKRNGYSVPSSSSRKREEDYTQPGPYYGSFNEGPDQMYPEEAMAMMTEKFTGQTACDHSICSCAMGEWENMSHESKEMWVDCITKRIQSERMSQVSNGVIDADVMYHPQAPLMAYEHLIAGWKHSQTGLAKKHKARQQAKRSKFHARFPDLDKQLWQRTVRGRKYLREEKRFRPGSPMTEAIVQADLILYKWRIGYYEFMVNQTYESMRTGDWHWPTTEEAAQELKFAASELRHVVVNQPYRELWHEGGKGVSLVYNWARNVFVERGVIQSLKDVRAGADAHFKRKAELNKPRREMLWNRFYNTPLFKWWSLPRAEEKGILGPFFRHVKLSIENYRRNWKDSPLNFWNADLHARGKVDEVINSWENPPWKPHQLENWERLGRIYYGLHHQLWPYQLEPHIRERFLTGGNCRVIDETFELTMRVVDYCANEYMPNLSFKKRGLFQGYLNETSPFRPHNYFYSNRNRYKYDLDPPMQDHDAWIRPKMISLNKTDAQRRREQLYKIDRNVQKRAQLSYLHASRSSTFPMAPVYTGPGGWNFYNWMYELVQDIINLMFDTSVEGWIDAAREWIQNPNTSESDYPDVGLRYWLLFLIRCEFPDNLNCSKGVGLEPAIIWVTVGLVASFLVGAFIFPPLLWPFYIISAPFIWLILVGIIGLHFSPRCVFLFPSVTGVSVALPFCLADEVTAIVDKYVTDCYVPLLIPRCMVNGPYCPVDPNQFIDIVNCKAVGVSDGVQHLLFLSYKAIGQWACDAFLWFSQVFTWLIPNLPVYMMNTLDSYKLAGTEMQCRQWWCFGLTGLAIALPILFLSIFAISCGLIIPPLIALLTSGWYLFEASPQAQGLPGYDNNWQEESDPTEVYVMPSAPPESDLTPENVQEWISKVQRVQLNN